jgi:hypothetical protein
MRRSDRYAEEPWARWFKIAWQALASSPVDEARMPYGMPQPSIF